MSYTRTDDKLDILIKLAISDCCNNETTELNKICAVETPFSYKYQQNKRKIIFRSKNKVFILKARKFAQRVAIIALATMSAAFISIMSISALRTPLIKTIVQWYNEYIAVHFETSDNTENPISANDTIIEFKKPLYLPENISEIIVTQNTGMYAVDYYCNDEFIGSYVQTPIQDNSYLFDDSSNVEHIKVNQHEGALIHNKESYEIDIIWHDDNYTYWLYSLLDVDESLKIAQSLGKN